MAERLTPQERQEKFEAYNPYARRSERAGEASGETVAMLAIAYELAQLRATIRFAGNGGRSS